DIVLGGDWWNGGIGTRGRGYLYLGGSSMGSQRTQDTYLDVPAADGAALAGFSSAIGDVNGDGYGDIVLGGPGQNISRGRGYLFLGGATLGAQRGQDTLLEIPAADTTAQA